MSLLSFVYTVPSYDYYNFSTYWVKLFLFSMGLILILAYNNIIYNYIYN